jgi:glycerophosphoryl diester phosphodiesterase
MIQAKKALILLFTLNFITISSQNQYKIFGHRGCRGIYPENTLNGFKKAIELNVDGIELDIVVNKNQELVISHEPYIDSLYCIKNVLNKKENIFKMNIKEIQEVDCGSKFIKEFPNQIKVKEQKPTFKEFSRTFKNYQGDILIEIKYDSNKINEYYPNYSSYAKLIYNETKNGRVFKNLYLMSFNIKILKELYKIMPDTKYIFLSESKDWISQMKLLSFKPHGVGVKYKKIKKSLISEIHNNEQIIYAWTVNKLKKYKKLIALGVDGIITDYPDIISK